MVYRASYYPLGQLLLECLDRSQLSIGRFVLAVGYNNSAKGVRAFDGMLNGGYPNKLFLERLCSSRLAPDYVQLNKAIAQTLEVLKEEEKIAAEAQQAADRAAFRPFFQAIPEEKTPRQISLFAFTGGHRRYTHYLPDSFLEWDQADQLQHLQTKVPEAFAKSEGRTLFMGKIIGYNLFLRFKEPALQLTIYGEPIGEADAIATPVADATIKIGGKTLNSEQAMRLLENNQPTS